ncbi:MAG: LysM peptidoglycan-binding domain-containing protein [Anaerolineales bacterium]|jgi:LysM repeat protein
MRGWKRVIIFLFLNVIVSAVTTVSVILWWERSQSPAQPTGLPALTDPTGSPDLPGNNERASRVYIVQYGDTLDSISQKFGVPVEQLMSANKLESATAIGVGQELFIPEYAASIPESVGQGGAGENDPTNYAGVNLKIVSVVGAGDLPTERVIVRNDGETEIALEGWQLASADQAVYTFPRLTLYKDGSITVHTADGQNTAFDLYWGQAEPAWQPGGTVTLLDPQGGEHVTFTAP